MLQVKYLLVSARIMFLSVYGIGATSGAGVALPSEAPERTGFCRVRVNPTLIFSVM